VGEDQRRADPAVLIPSAVPEVIESPQLDLVSFTERRARQVVEGRRQPSWDPGYPTPGDLEVAAWLLGVRFVPGDRRFLPRSIVVRSAGLVIGGIGCHGAPGAEGSVEIGYGIAEGWRGQGLGSEAVSAYVAHLRGLSEVRRVVAVTDVKNAPSKGALLSAGFVRVGGDESTDRFVCPR
jgi:[ribosomal protein S5]-alanine N-acetyltransferase